MNTFAAERVSCQEHCVFSRILGILGARLLFQSYVPITRDSMLSYVIAILFFFLCTWTARAKIILQSLKDRKRRRGEKQSDGHEMAAECTGRSL